MDINHIKRRVFVSLPDDDHLTEEENALKWGIVEVLEKLPGQFKIEIFFNPRTTDGLASRKVWTAKDAESVIRSCVGGVIIGMPRWRLAQGERQFLMASEFAQYEAAILKQLNLPMLVLVQQGVERRGVFDYGFGEYVCTIPRNTDKAWLLEDDFQHALRVWCANIADRRDIFLGYCSSSSATARALSAYIVDELGATILDWKTDFTAGRTILEEISEAADRCSAGLFLFTKDDMTLIEGSRQSRGLWRRDRKTFEHALPRDNVVFEAGYFIGLKGKRRVLIVKEDGAKLPADLGGDIYAALANRSDLEPVKDVIKKFVASL